MIDNHKLLVNNNNNNNNNIILQYSIHNNMSDLNPITDPDTRDISGPVNIIRLEGNIHGINKIIYLFMDYHMPVTSQTQCANVFSPDVQKYFAKNFYKLTEGSQTYDFFLEIYPSELADTRYRKGTVLKDYKEKYIEEVVNFFRKIFKYDSKKNKVSVNKLFKNVRLHYLDVRDYYKHNLFNKISEMSDIAHNFMRNDDINVNDLDHIIQLMYVMGDHIQLIIDILSEPINKVPKTKIIQTAQDNLDMQALEYLTNKIKNIYNHNDVKKVMNMLIKNSIKNFQLTIRELNDAIKEFTGYADTIQRSYNKLVRDENTSYLYTYGISSSTIRQMITNITNKVESLIDERFVEFFARFTDIYFLRRFLDKDYITNAIVYSGALHSNTYIHILVNYFDFKITNASYSSIKDMDKLTNAIKNKSVMEIQPLILPERLVQCSNMDDFPQEFL